MIRGKILNYNSEKGFGFILGEDMKKYFFHISNILNDLNLIDIRENYTVDFIGLEEDKGLAATQITVKTPLSSGSKDKMLKIKDLRIRASEIKEYELSVSDCNTQICLEGLPVQEYKLFEYQRGDDGSWFYRYRETRKDTFLSELIRSDDYTIMKHNTAGDGHYMLVSEVMSDRNSKYYELNKNYYRAEFINEYFYDKQSCFTITLTTYTSGVKEIYIGNKEEEADEWLNYIDDELEKLI